MHQPNPHEAGSRGVAELERPGVPIEVSGLARSGERRENQPRKCLASGHPAGGFYCPQNVPAGVAEASWARSQARGAGPAEGFFHFNWQGETWLAFGLADGEVRGVICPTHRAEREALALQSA